MEAILAAQADLLRGAGHDVRVLAGRGDAELIPELDSRHPEVELVTRALAAGDDAGEKFGQLQSRLRTVLSDRLSDRELVLVHNVMTMPFNLPAAAALADLRLPKVAWTHDLAWVDPRHAAYQRRSWPTSLLRLPQERTTYVAISEV
ncbi:MAG: glycosyltransferase, partial [Candidatus Dormibacteraeota bacterium]|nr:glycosyltransferase [Candidatus Dormibacteraeota bacterium]